MTEPRSCGFLVVRGNPIDSFLLMQHASRWDLPKGHVDPGETDLECALRELMEETGIHAHQLEVIPGFQFESRYRVNAGRYNKGSGWVEKTMLIFLGRLIADVPIETTEHQGYEWFPWSPPHRIQERAIDPLLASVEEFLRSGAGS